MRKELYHIVFSSHGEVLFRCPEDIGAFRNRMALRAYAHDTGILADAELSDHVHCIIETDCPVLFVSSLRSSYTKYMNHRYERSGRLGELGFFCRKLEGPTQMVTALSYVLRNGLHHGISPTPFAYPYSSVNEMFTEERGIRPVKAAACSRNKILSRLPRHSVFPDEYQVDENVVFLRRCYMEIARAESFYVTSRNFLFQMNRVSDERWLSEQQKNDSEHPPLRLEDLEPSLEKETVTELLANEKGWKYDPERLTDFQVCALIDKTIPTRFDKRSVYRLTNAQKGRLCTELHRQHHLPISQLSRCLALNAKK